MVTRSAPSSTLSVTLTSSMVSIDSSGAGRSEQAAALKQARLTMNASQTLCRMIHQAKGAQMRGVHVASAMMTQGVRFYASKTSRGSALGRPIAGVGWVP
jgi:hypothetical protein